MNESVERPEHPVDVVERLAALNEWAFDRADEDEISILVAGVWAQYEVAFTWLPDMESLHVSCSFDLKIPLRKRTEVGALVQMINEQLWLGHFDLAAGDNSPSFRYAVLMRGLSGVNSEQIEDLVEVAVAECERFYPAFQLVIWGGKPAEEAMATAMIDPIGEA